MILGIDEAGRGPWAGPLVVGAVVLGGVQIEGLTDSKKLTKKRREALYPLICEQAVACATGWVSAGELDNVGMSEALRLATRRAVEQIRASYSEIIIDGTVNFLAGTGKGAYVKTMKKADLLVPSVSAASILAKVERDWFMAEQDELYPGYEFKAHAGYGVAKHRAAIEELGVTPLHRLSFAPLAKYRTATSLHFILPAHPPRRSVGSGDRSEDFTGKSGKTTKSIGDQAEMAVAKWLERDGHVVIERNWRTRWCEIDIVSRKEDVTYFTEVKYRKNAEYGDGFAAITNEKLRQMKFAAEYFVLKNNTSGAVQLAAASVTGGDFAVEAWMALS